MRLNKLVLKVSCINKCNARCKTTRYTISSYSEIVLSSKVPVNLYIVFKRCIAILWPDLIAIVPHGKTIKC
jgi:hypothetical protein